MSGWKDWQIGEVVEASDFQSYVQNQVVQQYPDSAARGSAVATPVPGMVSYLQSTQAVEVYNGTAWNQISGSTSPNYIINGAFDIWQRGDGPFTVTNGYTADRWQMFEGVGDVSVTKGAFTAGELEVVGFGGAKNYLKCQIVTTGDVRLIQNVENVETLAGQTVTVSFWAKSDSVVIENLFLIQVFGTGGSADVVTTGPGFTVTSSWQRFTATLTLPSVAGKTIGANSALRVRIDPLNGNTGTLDIWGVQLEAGSVATPFRRNAPSLQAELAACQRYYQRVTAAVAGFRPYLGQAASTTVAVITAQLPTDMRTTPSITTSAIGELRLVQGTTFTTLSSIDNVFASPNIVNFNANVASGLTTGGVVQLRMTNSGTTWIDFSSEL